MRNFSLHFNDLEMKLQLENRMISKRDGNGEVKAKFIFIMHEGKLSIFSVIYPNNSLSLTFFLLLDEMRRDEKYFNHFHGNQSRELRMSLSGRKECMWRKFPSFFKPFNIDRYRWRNRAMESGKIKLKQVSFSLDKR